MGEPIDMICPNCFRRRICRDGLCDDCRNHLRITTGYTGPSSSQSKCYTCGGSGKIVHMFGPDTPCPSCGGTGCQ